MFVPVQLRIIHTILCILLALLYVSERALPCMETCEVACSCEQISDSAAGHGEKKGNGNADQHHCCSHCVCPCHTAAIAVHRASLVVPDSSLTRYRAVVQFPPSAPVSDLDHVPLA